MMEGTVAARSAIWGMTLALLAMVLGLGSSTASAQQKPTLAGDYIGMLGSLHLKLHLTVGADGAIGGTLDSPDQGAAGIPCSEFQFDGRALSFTVPTVGGSWKGTVESGGNSLSGTWSQGNPQTLVFTRDTAGHQAFVPAAKPSPVDGIWLGTIVAGSTSLRVQIQVKSDSAGHETCTLDSLDQHAVGLLCANVVFSQGNFSFDVPAVKGHWSGTLSGGGDSLLGTWNQGAAIELNFARQFAALTAAPIPPPTFDPAMAPVAVADLQAVLDADLAQALKSGQLAPDTDAGVAIGVVQHGVTRVFAYGTAKPDSIFEIGSITKTFTGLILAQMVEQGKVTYDEPVRELLPPGTVAKPAGDEITLLELATQRSGLPRMPDNFNPADKTNPYADYSAANLYAFIGQHGVARPADAPFLYSNLGFGLLGQALADRAGILYSALLKQEITGPLGLADTTIWLSDAQKARFIPGYDGNHHPARAWDQDALAGAGAIRSTAADMLLYLEANLHPDKITLTNSAPTSTTLSAALVESHEVRGEVAPGMGIALAWIYQAATGSYWHNGATGGYSAFASFNPAGDYGVVVLLNTSISSAGGFVDRLGEHINERLAGKPAISLAN